MAQSMRFGRRMALPSTRQIIHELRVLSAEEDSRKLSAAKPVAVADRFDGPPASTQLNL